MKERTYESIVMKYKDKATEDDMIRLTKLTSEFVEDPYDKDEFLDKVEDDLCYFLSEKEAKHYVSLMENDDPQSAERPEMDQRANASSVRADGLSEELRPLLGERRVLCL